MSKTIRKRRKSTRPAKEEESPKEARTNNSQDRHQGSTTTRRVAFGAVFVVVASVAACWLISTETWLIQADETDQVNQFVEWFHESGGWKSPNVDLASFPNYGNGLMAVGSNAIQKGDELLIVPESMQFSVESTGRRFRQLDLAVEAHISDAHSRYYQSPLERQDAILALSLMVECSLGDASDFYPYLAMLPENVPRLDTFEDYELDMLQDPSLKSLAEQSKHQLRSYYNVVQSAVRDLSKAAAAKARTVSNDSCLSFASFHRFVAIASSHAMILDNTKYLVPMADMINHAQHVDETTNAESFASYHVRNTQNGAITVLADRFVSGGHQIFEEYGKLDNTLYLLAHGFVPDDNPYHCAIVPAPRVKNHELIVGLEELQEFDLKMDSVCVPRDGAVDASTFALLALSSLELDHNAKQLERCVDAVQSREQVRAECIEYPGHGDAIASAIRTCAAAVLSQSPTTLEKDLQMLSEALERKEREQTLLALKFRIAEKHVLEAIGQGETQQE